MLCKTSLYFLFKFIIYGPKVTIKDLSVYPFHLFTLFYIYISFSIWLHHFPPFIWPIELDVHNCDVFQTPVTFVSRWHSWLRQKLSRLHESSMTKFPIVLAEALAWPFSLVLAFWYGEICDLYFTNLLHTLSSPLLKSLVSLFSNSW